MGAQTCMCTCTESHHSQNPWKFGVKCWEREILFSSVITSGGNWERSTPCYATYMSWVLQAFNIICTGVPSDLLCASMHCHALCTAVGPASGVMPVAGCLGFECNASWSLTYGHLPGPRDWVRHSFSFVSWPCADSSLQAVFLFFSLTATCENRSVLSANSLSNTIIVGSQLGPATCRRYRTVMLTCSYQALDSSWFHGSLRHS